MAVGKLLLTVENTMVRLRGKSKMKDKLLKLHDYLLSNGYIKDADRTCQDDRKKIDFRASAVSR